MHFAYLFYVSYFFSGDIVWTSGWTICFRSSLHDIPVPVICLMAIVLHTLLMVHVLSSHIKLVASMISWPPIVSDDQNWPSYLCTKRTCIHIKTRKTCKFDPSVNNIPSEIRQYLSCWWCPGFLHPSPGYHHPWYWLCRDLMFLSSVKKNSNYLRRCNVTT